MTSTGDPPDRTCKTIVTQMYTFSSWSKQKHGQSSSSMLPYVGFPGLSLTPIPESPLLDSSLNEDAEQRSERDKWLHADLQQEDAKNLHKPLRNGSLAAKHCRGKSAAAGCRRPPQPHIVEENGEVVVETMCGGDKDWGEKASKASPSTCSVNVHVVQTTTFLPKDEHLTQEEKRAHLCKLLLFALCGFVIVAGIVLWIFSPAFT